MTGGTQGTTTGGTTGGTAGASISTGGAAGAIVSGNPCGTHDLYIANRLSVLTSGPGTNIFSAPYEGPAVVERSTEDDLVIYFEPPRTMSGAGGTTGAGGATAVAPGFHATLSGWHPMPVLPFGAKLWLTKTPDGNQVREILFYGVDPWNLWLRDREGGALILGASRRAQSPIGLTNRAAYCSAMTNGCQPGITTYYTVDVQGDSPVTLRDGESATIQFDGRVYDVRLLSRTEPPNSTPRVCQDYTPEDGTYFDARAQNLTGITFDTGVPPSCVEGNDRVPYVSFYTTNRTFDGQLFYLGRASTGGALTFGVGGVVAVQLNAPTEVFPEPIVGQEFWFTATDWIQALRAPQHGEVLLATLRAGTFPEIAQVLGLTVTAEQDCAYTVGYSGATTFLSRVVFGSTPPTRNRSGSVGVVTIGGQNYHAATNGERVTLWK